MVDSLRDNLLCPFADRLPAAVPCEAEIALRSRQPSVMDRHYRGIIARPLASSHLPPDRQRRTRMAIWLSGGRQGVDAALQPHRLLRDIRDRGIGGRNPDHNPGPPLGNFRYHRSARDHHGRMAVATVHRWPRRRLCLAWHSLSISAVSLGGRHRPLRASAVGLSGKSSRQQPHPLCRHRLFWCLYLAGYRADADDDTLPLDFRHRLRRRARRMDRIEPASRPPLSSRSAPSATFSSNARSCVGPAAASRRDGCRPHPTKKPSNGNRWAADKVGNKTRPGRPSIMSDAGGFQTLFIENNAEAGG